MAYATITSDTISYQPYLNLKEFIASNLTNKTVKIYSVFPDMTQFNREKFPMIVLPYPSIEPVDDADGVLRQNIMYNCVIEGSVFHERSALADDSLRTISGDLARMFPIFSNRQLLSQYGIRDCKYAMTQGPSDASVVDNVALVEVQFTITFAMEVYMQA